MSGMAFSAGPDRPCMCPACVGDPRSELEKMYASLRADRESYFWSIDRG